MNRHFKLRIPVRIQKARLSQGRQGQQSAAKNSYMNAYNVTFPKEKRYVDHDGPMIGLLTALTGRMILLHSSIKYEI